MKPFHQLFLYSALLVALASGAQQPISKLSADSVNAVPVVGSVRPLLPLRTTQKGLPARATSTTAPLRLPAVQAGEARYNAQYKAYRQQQLSGVRDHVTPSTYMPPSKEKVRLLTKKPKHVPKALF